MIPKFVGMKIILTTLFFSILFNVSSQEIIFQKRKTGKILQLNLQKPLKLKLKNGEKFQGYFQLINDSIIVSQKDSIFLRDVQYFKVFKRDQKSWGRFWLVIGGSLTVFNAIKFHKAGWDSIYNNGEGFLVGSYISITALLLLTKRKKLSPNKWKVKKEFIVSID